MNKIRVFVINVEVEIKWQIIYRSIIHDLPLDYINISISKFSHLNDFLQNKLHTLNYEKINIRLGISHLNLYYQTS